MKKTTFYVDAYNIVTSPEDIDLTEIPASVKRRLCNFDKIALSLLSQTYVEEVDEIIFSSEYGELERLKNIIEQYQEFNEVSPTQFTGSVHNFPVGCFCQIKKSNVTYNAVSSGKESISMGLLQSIVSKNKKVLFCYSDYENLQDVRGCAVLISKENNNKSGFLCVLEKAAYSEKVLFNEFGNLVQFLKNEKMEFVSSLYKIKRVEI